MNPSDRVAFAECMAPFMSIYERQLTNLVLDVWWGALADYPLADVKIALALHTKDPDEGKFRPTPAHIINHLVRTIPEMRRNSRNLLRRQYQDRRNEIEAKQYMLANDHKHGLLEPDEYQRRMYAIARELSDLNAMPQFEPLLAMNGSAGENQSYRPPRRREFKGMQRLDPSEP